MLPPSSITVSFISTSFLHKTLNVICVDTDLQHNDSLMRTLIYIVLVQPNDTNGNLTVEDVALLVIEEQHFTFSRKFDLSV